MDRIKKSFNTFSDFIFGKKIANKKLDDLYNKALFLNNYRILNNPLNPDEILLEKLRTKSVESTAHGFKFNPEKKLSKSELLQFKSLWVKKYFK